ncbi:hypothetical protein M5689_009358 [Euphorbia peplus]|nr:hypothetical protein M5689_009358 [Euphorbia peplus]
MGLGGASRVSPDNSTRGHGFFTSEYRSFNNRGFGRGRGQGQPRSFQHAPQPVQRKGDILMEAGRLAAEYLASKGMLPQSTVPGKWQNGGLKKQVGDYQEDSLQDGRTSAHPRLGSSASDVGMGRRRYADDFNSRNHGKGRRRGEYYHRNNSSDWGKEYGRSGSWSDRSRVSSDNEGEDDTFSGNFEEQQIGEDNIGNRVQKSGQSGSAPESDEAADMESGMKYNNSDEMGSKVSTSSFEKDGTDRQPSKASDDVTDCNLGNEDEIRNNEADKQIVTIQTAESNLSGKHEPDLLTHCNFVKIPTRTRSALTYRMPKVNQVVNTEEVKTSEIGSPRESEVSVPDSNVEIAAANVLPNTNDSKFHDPEEVKTSEITLPDESAYEGGELESLHGDVQGKCMRSQSFSDRLYMHTNEQQLSQGVSSFGRSISVKERGEKRAAEDTDTNDTTKRPREWLPSLISTASDHLLLPNLSQNQESPRETMALSTGETIVKVEDSLVNSHQYLKPSGDTCAEYPPEKQLFSSSFKICDLNLMEASDINDNHCNDHILMYPPITASKTEASHIDIDLSMSNSNLSGEYTRCTGNGKNIEVIDLDNDSTEEDKAFDNSQRENDFSGTEEFLTTFSSCSSVAEDINPLQNEIGLHNGEETLGDDDSIYMSLGEIPLSFIPAWEQQTPNEYGKPF